MTTNEELIAEARAWTHHSQVRDHPVSAFILIEQLTDALAAVSDATPSEQDPEEMIACGNPDCAVSLFERGDLQRDPTSGTCPKCGSNKALRDSWSDELEYTDAPEAIAKALRGAGLLAPPAPVEHEKQVSAVMALPVDVESDSADMAQGWKDAMTAVRAALTAALPRLTEGLAEVIARHNQCIDWGTQDYEGACWGCDWEGEPGDFESHLAAIIAEELKRRIGG